MDGLKKAYYRTYQQVFDIGMRCLHWRKPIVISGAGCIRQVPDVLSKSGVTKVMVVTGSHVVKSLGPKLFAALEDAGMPYEVFSEVEANPSVNTVEKIRTQYLEAGCSGFVALGGGSPMDATKGAAARVACPKKSCNDMAGVMRVGKTVPPIVAIPTTSGTGSETTIAAVITDSETHHKYALMDLKLMPLYAILDPELTVGLPPRTTATTGMDALTHAIEAYISWTYNTKESLRLAEEAVKLIFDNLELAYQHGEDLKVRENMMIAAFKAGFAFSRAGVGNVHAIAHTLGGLYNTPHGLANAVILPIVLVPDIEGQVVLIQLLLRVVIIFPDKASLLPVLRDSGLFPVGGAGFLRGEAGAGIPKKRSASFGGLSAPASFNSMAHIAM